MQHVTAGAEHDLRLYGDVNGEAWSTVREVLTYPVRGRPRGPDRAAVLLEGGEWVTPSR